MNAAQRPFVQLGPDEPTGPVILSVPHAGRDYSTAMIAASRLRLEQLRALEDRYADLLAVDAAKAGFTTLIATRPRAWIDLNRDVREVDPDMIAPPGPAGPTIRSGKVTGGLGLLPRRLRGHGDVWRHRISAAELAQRIAEDHAPYHARLAALLAAARRRFGVAVLLDVHSMPPLPAQDGPAARLVIGDQFGRSAAGKFASTLHAVAQRAGISSAQNAPYAGGHVLSSHGAPARGVHALQLEIDRSLYLDARLIEPGPGEPRIRALVLAMAEALNDEALGAAAQIAAE
jgi:N-formylglutamate amidohydrolase